MATVQVRYIVHDVDRAIEFYTTQPADSPCPTAPGRSREAGTDSRSRSPISRP